MRQRGRATWPWMKELDAGLSLITSGKAPFSHPCQAGESQTEKQLPWTLDPKDPLFLLDEAVGVDTGSRKKIQPLGSGSVGWSGKCYEVVGKRRDFALKPLATHLLCGLGQVGPLL